MKELKIWTALQGLIIERQWLFFAEPDKFTGAFITLLLSDNREKVVDGLLGAMATAMKGEVQIDSEIFRAVNHVLDRWPDTDGENTKLRILADAVISLSFIS